MGDTSEVRFMVDLPPPRSGGARGGLEALNRCINQVNAEYLVGPPVGDDDSITYPRFECHGGRHLDHLLELLLEDRNNLALLLLRQPQLDRELVRQRGKRVQRELRHRDDLIVGVAELVAARGIVSVAELVERVARVDDVEEDVVEEQLEGGDRSALVAEELRECICRGDADGEC